ncbi:thiazole synthase [Gilvimarinus polysaccharolyticus]|uniref:thiazole synthase n=1 Tax=Gilvimarinus polysaccharolyticus TaxID=863921 RepID=UPI000673B8D1|nr:thiazole synthase [Gilvimarinus polysaccharolyticus]
MDLLRIYDKRYESRLILGTSRYPSPAIMQKAIIASGAQLVTVSLRRQQSNLAAAQSYVALINAAQVDVLPNTAGCESEQEAITLARMSREIFATDLIKLEIIGDNYTLQPDMEKTLSCVVKLIKEGFKVLPYCTDDLVACKKLIDAGCEVIMPWGSPIGSGKGLNNPYQLAVLRQRLPEATIVVDAGLGKPSHATGAMELGCDAVLLNTAVAQAHSPELMAEAFCHAVKAGRYGYKAGAIQAQEFATPSTATIGMPFRVNE